MRKHKEAICVGIVSFMGFFFGTAAGMVAGPLSGFLVGFAVALSLAVFFFAKNIENGGRL